MSVVPAPENEVFAANRACGRIALAVKADRGVTRRSRIREEGPLRVRCPGQPSAELEAVILNTAGGGGGGGPVGHRHIGGFRSAPRRDHGSGGKNLSRPR